MSRSQQVNHMKATLFSPSLISTMTRSQQVDHENAFNKIQREIARENFLYLRSMAAEERSVGDYTDMPLLIPHSPKCATTSAVARRNRGGMNGARWRRSNFDCGRELDEGDFGVDHADADGLELHLESQHEPVDDERRITQVNISIMDIAKPAKLKGVAKEFEVIKPVRKVIALEENECDFGLSDAETDEWEELFVEEVKQRKSYSEILRGHDT